MTGHVVEQRSYEPEDDEALTALYNVCFTRPREPARWQWLYRQWPGGADSYVLLVDGVISGFIGALWFDAYLKGEPVRVNRGSDFMIHPSLRGTGAWLDITKPYTADRKVAEIRYEFPSVATEKVATKSEYRMQRTGTVPLWIRWQSGRAVHEDNTRVPSIVAAPGAIALRARAALAGRSRRELVTVGREQFERWAPAFDRLADSTRDYATVVLRHDARFVWWRWFLEPAEPATVVVAPKGDDDIAGYVVYRPGGRNGMVGDLVAEDEDTMQALLGAATRGLTAAGSPRMRLHYADPRPWTARALRRAGFMPRGVGPRMTARVRRDLQAEDAQPIRVWHLNTADYG